MTRKILYSPTWGAGWSTWNDGDAAKYMLEYQPIIEFLEAGNKFTDADTDSGEFGRPSTLHPLLEQLRQECEQKFGEEYICVLGADGLQVAEVDGPVHVNEYDGNESLDTPDSIEWS